LNSQGPQDKRDGKSAPDGLEAQLIFFSEIKWTYMRTRKQFLVRRLPERWRVVFLEPFAFGRRNSFRPVRDGRVTYVTVPFLRGGTTSGLYNRVVGLSGARWVLSRLCTLWVRALLSCLGSGWARVFIVSNPYAADTALSLRRDLLCYDYNDNPFQFPQTPEWVRPGLDALLMGSDMVFVVSRHYLEMLSREGVENLHLLGNGVEYEHFSRRRPEPEEINGMDRPLLLYTGRIGPLIDFDLLGMVADAFPAATLLAVGPVDPISRGDLSSLLERHNVLWMDERPYDELPAYIQASDVCLAPFRFMDTYTVGVNPNKIYQYLAAGRPVVSSYFAELDGHADVIGLARDAREFIDIIARTLASPPPVEGMRRLASANDWSIKADTMAGLIEAGLGAARPGAVRGNK
jgi:teichuronic acid biosynthesis glycosyltransferase TuaH